MEGVFAAAGVPLKPCMELGSVDIQKDLAAIGVGTAIVPDFSVADEVEAGKLHAHAVAGIPPNTLVIAVRRTSAGSAAIAAFVEGMLGELKSDRQPRPKA